MPAQALRKNSKAKSWTSKKIAQLQREGYPKRQAVAIGLSEAKKHGLVRNPQEEEELRDSLEDAQELSRGFHGRGNEEEIEFVEQVQYRENLALLGEMVELEVFINSRKDEGLVPIAFSRKKREVVFLNSSPDRKQLYLVGDTSLPDDWLEEASPEGWDKDKVFVGWAYSISYAADKHHLEGSSGKVEDYIHSFGEQTFKAPAKFEGVWVLKEKIQAGMLPRVVYDRLNERIELVGGGYVVKDEGIWD